MTAKTREAFEALMARTHPHLHLTRWNIDGAYVSGVASDCWLTWQAGSKQAIEACIAAAEGVRIKTRSAIPSDLTHHAAIDRISGKLKELL